MYYFDYGATTPVDPDILKIFNQVSLEELGHPGGIHKLSTKNAQLIESSKKVILANLNLPDYKCYFTSGGTEANNLAILGYAKKYSEPKHFITTKIEHPSVYDTFVQLTKLGHEVTFLNVDQNGQVDLIELQKNLKSNTVLVSIMTVNHETGVIQNLKKVSEIIRQNSDAKVMTDFVQGLGKTDTSNLNNADIITISSHKIYGPKGQGAIIIKNPNLINNIFFGGKMEGGIRPGTPNLPAIVAMAKAVQKIMAEQNDFVKDLNHYLRDKLQDVNVQILTPEKLSVPHIINIIFPNETAQVIVQKLSLAEIYVSSTSACSAKEAKPSRVVKNITKNDELAKRSIRISISSKTTKAEIDYLVKNIKKIVESE